MPVLALGFLRRPHSPAAGGGARWRNAGVARAPIRLVIRRLRRCWWPLMGKPAWQSQGRAPRLRPPRGVGSHGSSQGRARPGPTPQPIVVPPLRRIRCMCTGPTGRTLRPNQEQAAGERSSNGGATWMVGRVANNLLDCGRNQRVMWIDSYRIVNIRNTRKMIVVA